MGSRYDDGMIARHHATLRSLLPSPLALILLAVMAAGTVARAQPIDLESWSRVETPHVTLLTDAEPRRGAEVAATLEQFRAVFAQLAPGLELEAPAPTHMIAFRDAERYAPYQRGGGRGVSVLGQFLTSADGNVLTLNADPRFVGAFSVIYHEYVHYLVGTNLPDVPRWFNEGLAEYYSTFRIEGEHALIGRVVPRHQAWLSRHGIPSLAALLATEGRSGRHGAEEVGAFYAGSWLLVHYLLSGDGDRIDQTAALLARLASGDDAIDALETIFGVRVSELEQRLADHLASDALPEARLPLAMLAPFDVGVSPAAPADVLVRLGDLSARLGTLHSAAAHFYEALGYVPDHAEAHGGLAWVRDLEGRYDEAEVLYRDALAYETRDPVVLLRWGRHLLSTLDADLAPPERDAREDWGEDEPPAVAGHGETGGRAPQTADEASGAVAEPSLGEASAGVSADPLAGSEPVAEPTSGPVARANQARRAFERVTEIDPSFAEGWAMHGVAHLAPGAEPADGIPSLERAVARLPARLDLIARLVSLEARAGHFESAEQRIEWSLAERAEPAVVEQAREEVERWRWLIAAQEAFDQGEVEQGLRFFDEAVSVTSDPLAREQLENRLRYLQEATGH